MGLVAHGRWDLPDPEIASVFPALVGGLLTLGHQGLSKPRILFPRGNSVCFKGAGRDGRCMEQNTPAGQTQRARWHLSADPQLWGLSTSIS